MIERTYASVPSGRARNSRRHGVGAQVGRHDLHRALLPETVGELDQPDLGFEVEPVARLCLDGGHAVPEHLVQPAPSVSEQRFVRGGSRGGDRGKDPAAAGQDLEIAGPALPKQQFTFAGAREEQVRVRVDQTGRDRAAGGVDTGETSEWIALPFDHSFDRGSGPDGGNPSLPASDDWSIGRRRAADVGRGVPNDLALALASPDAAFHGHDLGRSHDQEPRGRLVAAAAFDDPERAAVQPPEPGPNPRRDPAASPARAASSRSSNACIGEKSRRRR